MHTKIRINPIKLLNLLIKRILFCRFELISILQVPDTLKVKDFKQNKAALNRELERFMTILDDLLPRYSLLLDKDNISSSELTELGEIEHYLIEVNAKISTIKNMLEQDLFGHSLDVFYKLKVKAKQGDNDAQAKLDRMREVFEDSLKSGNIFVWN